MAPPVPSFRAQETHPMRPGNAIRFHRPGTRNVAEKTQTGRVQPALTLPADNQSHKESPASAVGLVTILSFDDVF